MTERIALLAVLGAATLLLHLAGHRWRRHHPPIAAWAVVATSADAPRHHAQMDYLARLSPDVGARVEVIDPLLLPTDGHPLEEVPSTFFFDADGNLVEVWNGVIGHNNLTYRMARTDMTPPPSTRPLLMARI